MKHSKSNNYRARKCVICVLTTGNHSFSMGQTTRALLFGHHHHLCLMESSLLTMVSSPIILIFNVSWPCLTGQELSLYERDSELKASLRTLTYPVDALGLWSTHFCRALHKFMVYGGCRLEFRNKKRRHSKLEAWKPSSRGSAHTNREHESKSCE